MAQPRTAAEDRRMRAAAKAEAREVEKREMARALVNGGRTAARKETKVATEAGPAAVAARTRRARKARTTKVLVAPQVVSEQMAHLLARYGVADEAALLKAIAADYGTETGTRVTRRGAQVLLDRMLEAEYQRIEGGAYDVVNGDGEVVATVDVAAEVEHRKATTDAGVTNTDIVQAVERMRAARKATPAPAPKPTPVRQAREKAPVEVPAGMRQCAGSPKWGLPPHLAAAADWGAPSSRSCKPCNVAYAAAVKAARGTESAVGASGATEPVAEVVVDATEAQAAEHAALEAAVKAAGGEETDEGQALMREAAERAAEARRAVDRDRKRAQRAAAKAKAQ